MVIGEAFVESTQARNGDADKSMETSRAFSRSMPGSKGCLPEVEDPAAHDARSDDGIASLGDVLVGPADYHREELNFANG